MHEMLRIFKTYHQTFPYVAMDSLGAYKNGRQTMYSYIYRIATRKTNTIYLITYLKIWVLLSYRRILLCILVVICCEAPRTIMYVMLYEIKYIIIKSQ